MPPIVGQGEAEERPHGLPGGRHKVTGGRGDLVAGAVAQPGLDTTFDTDGRATIGPAATGRAVIVDTSNRVVVGGSQDGVAKVWRLTAAGALDTTFNLSN